MQSLIRSAEFTEDHSKERKGIGVGCTGFNGTKRGLQRVFKLSPLIIDSRQDAKHVTGIRRQTVSFLRFTIRIREQSCIGYPMGAGSGGTGQISMGESGIRFQLKRLFEATPRSIE